MRMTELAAKLNLDQSNLTKSLENNPSLSRLEEVANALGVSVRDLLPYSPPAEETIMVRIGDRHYELIPTTAPQTPFNADLTTLAEKIRDLVLSFLKEGKTTSFSSIVEEKLLFSMFFDGESGKLFVSWGEDNSGSKTYVYSPAKWPTSPITYAIENFVTNETKKIVFNILDDLTLELNCHSLCNQVFNRLFST